MALLSLRFGHSNLNIPWPPACAPVTVQQVTLSPEPALRRAGEAPSPGRPHRARDAHGPDWPRFRLLSRGQAAHQVGQSFLACGPIMLYPCLPVPGGGWWGSMRPCARCAPCHHPRLSSLANAVKVILPLPCSHREIKATAVGMVKREPNYIYNIKVSAFVPCCSPGSFISRKTQISIFHFHILTRKIACSQLRPIAFGMYATIL